MVNYYAELGLDRGLDEEGLKQELAKLRRKWQSRANSANTLEDQHKAENYMKLIREASAILLVKEERAKYDKKLDKDPALSGQQIVEAEDTSATVPTSFLDQALALDALEEAYDKSKYNSVIAIANELLKGADVSERVYRLLALSYIETGRTTQAIATMQNMIQALPDDIDARYWAAFFDLRLLSGRAREARKHIDWLLQSEEGASARVAALDVEFYIDTGDFELADAKTAEYQKTVGTDRAFTQSIGNAYRQHAETFCTEYGGDTYFDTKSDFENWKKYHELSLSIYPDSSQQSTFKENLKIVDGVTFEKSNFSGILFAFIFGALLAGDGIGFLFMAVGLFITVFSFVPKWMYHKSCYTGHLEGLYLVAEWCSKIVGVVFNAIVWIIKMIFNIIFAFLG